MFKKIIFRNPNKIPGHCFILRYSASFIITKIVHSTRFRRRITENEGETTTSRPEGTTSTDNATPTRRLPNYRKPSEVDHSNEHLFANEPMNSRETSHTTKRELGGHI